MSILHKVFKGDENLEQSGVLLQYGTVKRDGKDVPVTIRIARAGGSNKAFDKVFARLTKPYKRLIQADMLDPKVGQRLMREAYAETVILGWENVQNSEDAFLEFTKENVIELFEELPDLFTDVVTQANTAALFRAELIEADAKN